MYNTNYNQQYPRTQQPSYSWQQQPLQTGLKGRPVSSFEEARASSIDFDGSVFFFPDLANRRIYTKQINMDGTSTLNMYELKEFPVEPANNNSSYITREEFENVISQLRAAMTYIPQPIQPQEQKKEEIKNFM